MLDTRKAAQNAPFFASNFADLLVFMSLFSIRTRIFSFCAEMAKNAGFDHENAVIGYYY
jgi:hypothetical protein